MKKLKDVERVMVFIELVKGCDNTVCPSYHTLCGLDETTLRYMSPEQLEEIVESIKENKDALENIGRVDIWAYGCGDTLLHPDLDKMATILSKIPYKKTIAIDSNCWRDNTGWGDFMQPVVLFKEGSFSQDSIYSIARKWNKEFNAPRFGFILKTLTQDYIEKIRNFQCFWNYPFIKVRSFHHVPLGTEIDYTTIAQYSRPPINIGAGLDVQVVPTLDKKGIRCMYRFDGTLRRCLVSTTEKTSLSEFLQGDLQDCEHCWPYMAGEQILIFPDKILKMESARCVSDKG